MQSLQSVAARFSVQQMRSWCENRALPSLIAISISVTFSTSICRGQTDDPLGQDALTTILGDLTREIENGSASQNLQTPVYLPTSNAYMVPVRNTPTTPASALLRISSPNAIAFPGADHPASAVNSTTAPALSGVSVSPMDWNRHYLLPLLNPATPSDSTPSASFTPPSWVYVTGTGPVMLSAPDTSVIGRYAYAVYDESSLLDVNVAGFPRDASTPAMPPQYAPKGALAFADLTQLPGVTQAGVNNLVAWRNYASLMVATSGTQPGGTFPDFTFADAGALPAYLNLILANKNGFLTPNSTTFGGQTDRIFSRRLDLINFVLANGTDKFNPQALQYLTHFSRAVTTPAWSPTTPAGSTIDYAGMINDPTAINRSLIKLRHTTSGTTTHYKDDGTTETILVRVGDPVVPRRFSLAKLAWLGHDGPNAASFAPSLTSTQRADAIYACFGLTWHPSAGGSSSNARWDYSHGDPNRIKVLEEVRQAGREPDFFELLQAGILIGSLGGHPGTTANDIGSNISADWEGPIGKYFDFYSARKDQHVLQIGANIIDQADADNFPTAIFLNNSTRPASSLSENEFNNTVFGVENLPVLARMGLINHMTSPESAPPPGPMAIWFQPEVWNPYESSTVGMNGLTDASHPTPSALRLVTYGRCYVWNSREDPNAMQLSQPIDFGNDFTNPAVDGMIGFKNPSPLSTNPKPFFDNPVALTGLELASATTDYSDARSPSGPKNRYPVGATWLGSSGKFLGVYLGEVFRDPITYPQYSIRVVPDYYLSFVLEYFDGGSWRPYSTLGRLVTLHGNAGGSGSKYGTSLWGSSCGHIDPRTDRFSGSAGRFGPGNNAGWGANMTVRPSSSTAVALSGTLGRSPVFQAWPRPSAGFTHTPVSSAGGNAYLFDDWALNIDTPAGSNPVSASRYSDPDGVTRPGDSWRADYPSGDGVMTYHANQLTPTAQRRRPVILNRPFRSVGELGFVFRDLPFKSLDFWSDKSGDNGLLDLFTVHDEPVVAAGFVNPNTAPSVVLQAVIAGASQNESQNVTVVGGGTNSDAASVASAIASQLSVNPLINRAGLSAIGNAIQTGFSNSTSDAALKTGNKSNKTYAEAPLRALSSVSNTRTWNLMIDLVAQTGNMPASATSLADFNVQKQTHYWLHVAIDRFTGQIVDEILEQVPTAPTIGVSQVAENLHSGAEVGSLSASGSDPGATFTYALVSGAGSADNASFTIAGNKLLTASTLQFLTKSAHSIRVRATDQSGSSMEQELTISVLPGPYTKWKIEKFLGNANNPAVAGDSVSPANDGLPNLIKYALGLEPYVRSTSGLSLTRPSEVWTLSYARAHAATDITVHAYWSKDLKNWDNNGVTETLLSDDNTVQLWQATVPVSPENPHIFMRLQITRP